MKLKMNKTKVIGIFAVLAMSAGSALAQGSGTHGGDSNELTEFVGLNGEHLDSWYSVKKDLLKGIRLGKHETLDLNGLDPDEFASKVTDAINTAKVSWDENPVEVAGVPRICENFIRENQMHIHCNEKAYALAMSNGDAESQYRLIAHEYFGVAGIEPNLGGVSDYFISSQISKSLQLVMVKKWAVKSTLPRNSNAGNYQALAGKQSAYILIKSDSPGRWGTASRSSLTYAEDHGILFANQEIKIPVSLGKEKLRLWANLGGIIGSLSYQIVIDGSIIATGRYDFFESDLVISPRIFDLELK